jgi:hypothetical protein
LMPAAAQHQSEWAGPEPLGKGVGPGRYVCCPVTQLFGIGQMHDEGMVGRPPLEPEHFAYRLATGGIGAQPVDRLRWKGHDLAGPQQAGCGLNVGCRHHVHEAAWHPLPASRTNASMYLSAVFWTISAGRGAVGGHTRHRFFGSPSSRSRIGSSGRCIPPAGAGPCAPTWIALQDLLHTCGRPPGTPSRRWRGHGWA